MKNTGLYMSLDGELFLVLVQKNKLRTGANIKQIMNNQWLPNVRQPTKKLSTAVLTLFNIVCTNQRNAHVAEKI